jgi:predicted RNA-binding Zn-ribbon protein involved in translation (DUF1610 family)
MAYIYAAALHCDKCGEEIVRRILKEWKDKYQGKDGIVDCRNDSCKHRWTPTPDEFDEASNHHLWFKCPECGDRRASFDDYSFDSDDFPKHAGEDGGESDHPEHCSSCHEPLDNPLTDEGVEYVLDKIRESIEEALREGRAKAWDRIMPLPGTAEEDATWLQGKRHVEIVRGWAKQIQDCNFDDDEAAIVSLFLELSEPLTL